MPEELNGGKKVHLISKRNGILGTMERGLEEGKAPQTDDGMWGSFWRACTEWFHLTELQGS